MTIRGDRRKTKSNPPNGQERRSGKDRRTRARTPGKFKTACDAGYSVNRKLGEKI